MGFNAKKESEADRDLLKLSNKYGGFADFLNEKQCEDRIASNFESISGSELFQQPIVLRYLWKQEYTAEEYYGFVQTGNHFLQLPEETKEMAHKEIIEHANKYEGKIVRPYLCVLYMARKK